MQTGGTGMSNVTLTRRHRPRWAALLLATTSGLIACGVDMSNAQTSSPVSLLHPQFLFGPTKTATLKRGELPAYEQSYLPNTGLVFFTGGTVSRAGVYVLDIASHKLTALSAKEMGQPVSRDHDAQRKTKLDADELTAVIRLANTLWASEDSYANLPPRASANVRLVLVDQGTIKDINSYGPAKGELKVLFEMVLALAAPPTRR